MPRIPVDPPYSTDQSIPFGDRDTAAKYGKHAGTDYAVPTGRKVYAPAGGTVTPYAWGTYHGNVVQIFDGASYPHCFHLSRIVVSPGDVVVEGQLIGYSGATGQGVTGPHVHFGISTVSVEKTTSFDQFIDPAKYLTQGVDEMTDENYVTAFFIDLFGTRPVQSQIDTYVNRPWKEVYNELRSALPHQQFVDANAYYRKLSEQQAAQIKELEDKLATDGSGEVTQLSPGTYRVR